MIASLRSYTSDPILPAQELNLWLRPCPSLSTTSKHESSVKNLRRGIRLQSSFGRKPLFIHHRKLQRHRLDLLVVSPSPSRRLLPLPTPTLTGPPQDLLRPRNELASRLAEQGTPICTICFVLGHFAEGHVPSRNAANNAAQRAKTCNRMEMQEQGVACCRLDKPASATNPDVETLSRALESSLYF